MLTVHRGLKPSLILSIALIASCLSRPESPEPEPALNATASTTDTVLADQGVTLSAAEQDAEDVREANLLDALRTWQAGHEPDITQGGHCNVRLTECDPYPIGRGNHRRADAFCSQVCLDTIAHCEDCSTAEIEFCCGHPGPELSGQLGARVSRQALHAVGRAELEYALRARPESLNQ